MTTPYSDVDNVFLNKITDDLLLTLESEDVESLLSRYRKSASVKFKKCKKLSDRDEVLKQYVQTLTDEEIEILANLMVIEWLRSKINSIEILKQTMSTRDYSMYSQANHLDSLIRLKQSTTAEIDSMIVSYTYSENNLSDLGKM